MDTLNHLTQPDLFALSPEEGHGVARAIDAMRSKGEAKYTWDEQIGVTLTEERIREERKRRNGLQLPKDAPHDEGLIGVADEVSNAYRKDLGQE